MCVKKSGLTNLINRRTFLKKYIIGISAGVCLLEFPSRNAFASVDQSTQSSSIVNKPFINALNYIVTPTYDQSGQAIHPSVVDFKSEYGMDTWGGFRYWMAFTPYPKGNYTFENPSLLVSVDGLNWISPQGITEPLVIEPAGSINGHYNSDPELVYDPDNNVLVMYWREYSRGVYERIWTKKISLNFASSENFICFEKAWDYKTGLILSPTVWRKSAQEWFMWTTDGNITMHMYKSIDGMTWSPGQVCSAPWSTWNGGYIPWHITAKPNNNTLTIEFLIAGWSLQGSIRDCQLFYATAPMAQPQELSMPLTRPLLVASVGDQWDNGYIYRSGFTMEPGNKPEFHIWYSACSSGNVWHIGYTEGKLI